MFDSKDYKDENGSNYPDSLRYWRDVQGFPASKIIMVIAGYERGFKAPDWGVKATGASQYPYIAYSDIVKLIGHGWARRFDAAAHALWLLSDDKTDRISYDDPQSVADKAVWMKQQKFAVFFHLGINTGRGRRRQCVDGGSSASVEIRAVRVSCGALRVGAFVLAFKCEQPRNCGPRNFQSARFAKHLRGREG